MDPSEMLGPGDPFRSSIYYQVRPIVKKAVLKHMHKCHVRKLDASDIAQDVFVSARQHIGSFRGKTMREFVAWLTKITKHQCVNVVRHWSRACRDAKRESSLPSTLQPASLVSTQSPSYRLESIERAAKLRDVLDRLPVDERKAICMYHLEDRPIGEIAEVLDRSPPGVAGLLRRGIERLRASKVLSELDDVKGG